MFVQIIRARTSDPEGVAKHGERWQEELRPGAEGYLGSTAGVTADGETVAIVRFADEDAAKRNSERPEQGEWWSEMEELVDGATFAQSSDVELLFGGGSDDAGFVQVMEGSYSDADAVRAAMTGSEVQEGLRTYRPDLLGASLILHDGRFTQVNYFTSEAEARENEQKDPPPEMADQMAEIGQIMKVDAYLDITEPQIH